MKLAEALRLRVDLQDKLDQLERRISNNLRVPVDDDPQEKPWPLINDFESISKKKLALISKITQVNATTTIAYASHFENTTLLSAGEFDNMSLKGLVVKEYTMEYALAERDILRSKIQTYRSFTNEASRKNSGGSKNEIKYVATVNIKDLQRKLDHLLKIFRLLETRIQECNWTAEIDLE